MSPPKVDWEALFKSAAAGKYGAPFPEGNLVSGVKNDKQIQFYHEPAEGGALDGAEINIYYPQDPMADYNELKKESLEKNEWRIEGKEIDGWEEWPRGYPDQNDYEDVSACAKVTDGHQVAWVQGKALVVLATVTGADKLKEYADGVWNIVNKAKSS
jgi:hypothetical protein